MKSLTVFWILLLVTACGLPKKSMYEENDKQSPTSNYILNLQKIDNLAKVYINDSLVYTSMVLHGNPEVDYFFDFSPFIKDSTEVLSIQLFNGEAPFHPQEDKHWEIRYYIIIRDEIVEFDHETGDDYQIGDVYEAKFKISELIDLVN